MRIAITSGVRLPVSLYGGIERVIWDLTYELTQLGHEVTLIAPVGTKCEFAKVLSFENVHDIPQKIPSCVDVVHFNTRFFGDFELPHIISIHGNCVFGEKLSNQSVFVSKNQSYRYGSQVYVYNGLNFHLDSMLSLQRKNFHFLGKAAWRKKNVRGAIWCA